VIGATSATSVASTVATAQTVSVTVASSDTFIFRAFGNTGDGTNSAGATHLDAFASENGNQFASLFHDAPSGPSQAQFLSAAAGHAPFADPGSHDGPLATNFHFTDPQFGHFIIS
jgi:hypothetical protein